ncbi:MAG TPA: thiol reductant ABC exporter subunit CydC, partial [Jatrophihabitans sp.]|nr:thiol reductant ABC exporter subunit CydC [Jatrophihabitans sp.]
GIARPVLRYLGRLINHDAAFRLVADLRATVYERLVPLAPARLGAQHRGQVLAGVVADVDAAQDLHLRIVEPAATAALVSTACVGFAFAVLPSAGAVLAVGFLAAGVVAPLIAAATLRRATARIAPRRAALTAAVVDLLRGAPDLIAVDAATAKLADLDERDAELTRMARRAAWATGLGAGVATLAAGATVWFSAVFGTRALGAGDLPGVALAVVVLVPLAAFEALAPLPQAAVLVTQVRSAAERLFGLLQQRPAVIESSDPAPLPAPPYTLELRGAAARWAPGAPRVLAGVDLTLGPGEHVAISGASGSGKSTLAALLLRFLDPQDRRTVSLNGVDVCDLAVDDVRGVVGHVAADAHIFASDLRENLRLARPQAGDRELIAVLHRVRLGAWYAGLPDGLATYLGENGTLLSGGERRRIALARALLADQPVLVLDEPTEGLDEPTAAALLADLLDTASGRTVLLLSHRTEGVDLVDRAYRLVDGRLERAGTGSSRRDDDRLARC